MKPEDDRDLYLWIIWYIWKDRNDKLFRGIDRDPLELVRYAKVSAKLGIMQRKLHMSLHRYNLLKIHKPYAWVISVWWMVHGAPQISLVEWDVFGRIAWERFSSCEQGILGDVRHLYTRNWKRYDGQWRAWYNTRLVIDLRLIAMTWLQW